MNPPRPSFAAFLGLGLAFTSGLAATADTPKPEKPNILIIYADDLGYGDVQCYNPERGKIPTPHIDMLAGQGMRFTDAHSSSSVCAPSRYTILTGLYNLDDDLGETNNLAGAMPEKVAEMRVLMEKLITDGRSTPGAKQPNDVEVVRHPKGNR